MDGLTAVVALYVGVLESPREAGSQHDDEGARAPGADIPGWECGSVVAVHSASTRALDRFRFVERESWDPLDAKSIQVE